MHAKIDANGYSKQTAICCKVLYPRDNLGVIQDDNIATGTQYPTLTKLIIK